MPEDCYFTNMVSLMYVFPYRSQFLSALFDKSASPELNHAGRPLAEGNQHWRKWIHHRRTIWGGGSKNEDKHWAICQAFGQRSVFSINQFKHIQVNRLRRESIIFFPDQKCIKQALVLTSSFWMSTIYSDWNDYKVREKFSDKSVKVSHSQEFCCSWPWDFRRLRTTQPMKSPTSWDSFCPGWM